MCVCTWLHVSFWNLFICLSVLLWFSIFYPHSILQWECISSSKNCQSKWITRYCIFEYISFPFLNCKFKLWQLLYMYVYVWISRISIQVLNSHCNRAEILANSFNGFKKKWALIRSNLSKKKILHLPLYQWITKKFCILVFADVQWVNNLGHTNITHTVVQVVQCTFICVVDALFCMLDLFCKVAESWLWWCLHLY